MSDIPASYDEVYLSSFSYEHMTITESCYSFDFEDQILEKETNFGDLEKFSQILSNFGTADEGILEENRVNFPAFAKFITRIEEIDEEPRKCAFNLPNLREILKESAKKAEHVLTFAVEKRRNQRKVKHFPDFFPQIPFSSRISRKKSEKMHKFALNLVEELREKVFLCEELHRNDSNPHTSMGILYDSSQILFKFVENIADFLKNVSEKSFFNVINEEKLRFLERIERNSWLDSLCSYSVTSKEASTAKSDVRGLYLSLGELRDRRAGEGEKKGGNYDGVKSLEEVLELVEGKHDSEIEQFRRKLDKMKPFGRKIRPDVSETFVERLQTRMRGM